MPLIQVPLKPFPNYKWRWATVTPTESLNDPPIYLGVLRVFNKFQNHSTSSTEVMNALRIVEEETSSSADLVRDSERNLIRNSGQYWKALGLLGSSSGIISVSPFGQLLANGKITQVEFATTVIKTLELPNKRIARDTSDWENSDLKIKPLELILNILVSIKEKVSLNDSYITPNELIKIVIPLAGAKVSFENCAEAIIQYRNHTLDISQWPDCAIEANDKRMAREFLLFLSNYGFCKRDSSISGNTNEKYHLSDITKEEIRELNTLEINGDELDQVVRKVKITQIPSNIERKRVSRVILERPYQNVFRRNVLNSFNSRCIITGATIENVLEAAHIKPVSYQGDDSHTNGLCLRSDIHQLFDSNHLRILPSGDLLLSESASTENNYGNLPRTIELPEFVNRDYLNWRIKYY